MAVYQEKAKERIRKHLTSIKNINIKAQKEDKTEADVRQIVMKVLTNLLGWNDFENITGEQLIRGHYADFVVKTPEDELFVIEVKRANMKLKESHLYQAQMYALNEGISWVVLTNGDDWQVYKVTFDRQNLPKISRVFTVKISDPNVKPKDKAELLYLLTEEASRKSEIEDYYERRVALSAENLARHVLSEPVINKLRIQLNKCPKQRFTNKEIAEALNRHLFGVEAKSEEIDREVKKVK